MKTKSILVVTLWALVACNRVEQKASGPLKQRGYVWQREWTPAVVEALGDTERRMDGVVLLGAEIKFSGKKPEIAKTSIDWGAVKRQTNHYSIALRVAPYAGPFRDDAVANTIVNLAKELVNDARIHDVSLEEFQFDFDCSKKNLASYREWLRILRTAIRPIRFVITTLPAWLDDSEFRALVRETDGYVLQAHSVPISNGREGTLCDTRLARQWVDKAASLGLPFSLALPTYRCSAGYGPDGKLLSVAMDSVQPVWPPGTHILEFGANADEIAALVNDLQKSRPPELRELIWYRVPIATDIRNWRWITLAAVITGRNPEHKIDIVQEGENPVDLSIMNSGETDEEMTGSVTVNWNTGGLTASDALAGWSVHCENNQARFRVNAHSSVRLPPGAARRIGWLRFDQPTTLQTELSN